MKPTMTKISAVLMTGLVSLASIVPAQAQNVTLSFGQRQRVVQTFCDRHPNNYDCRGYYDGRWNNRDYDNFYNRNRNDLAPVAAGIFGLALGAILGGAIVNNNGGGRANGDRVIGRVNNNHVARCYARYKSYDERSDTYLGYDGYRHSCNL